MVRAMLSCILSARTQGINIHYILLNIPKQVKSVSSLRPFHLSLRERSFQEVIPKSSLPRFSRNFCKSLQIWTTLTIYFDLCVYNLFSLTSISVSPMSISPIFIPVSLFLFIYLSIQRWQYVEILQVGTCWSASAKSICKSANQPC